MIAMEHGERQLADCSGQISDDRRQTTEDRDQTSEVRRQRKTGKFFAATSGLYRLDRFLLVR